jgi:hypothetical protein
MAYLEQTQLTDEKDVIVNPGSEEALVLLRRMVKLMESQATVDSGNRQRISLSNVEPNLTLGGVTTVTSVTTVNAVTSITNPLPAGTNAIGYIGGILGDTRIDLSRQTYSTAIRDKLTFS